MTDICSADNSLLACVDLARLIAYKVADTCSFPNVDDYIFGCIDTTYTDLCEKFGEKTVDDLVSNACLEAEITGAVHLTLKTSHADLHVVKPRDKNVCVTYF